VSYFKEILKIKLIEIILFIKKLSYITLSLTKNIYLNSLNTIIIQINLEKVGKNSYKANYFL
jgi:hypothetical protein